MNNDDTISREAALEALAFGTAGDYDTLHVYEAKDRIAALPSVPPHVVHGSPCDLCRYSPPSSCDDKPCTMCPAEVKMDGGEDDG
jgi:hypothetical protein